MFDRSTTIEKLNGSVVSITGGTGSFGNTIAEFLLQHTTAKVRIISRDERKQELMRRRLQNTRCDFYIADVRDEDSLHAGIKDADFVFHAAALKQVPSCEFFPLEAVKTNVYGTNNVLKTAIKYDVQTVVCLSTDKAVSPINAMGISKAMMERIALATARDSQRTRICVTRYGNVMGSRGSVIPVFWDQINSNKSLTVTDGRMTRFLMDLEQSVDLVLKAFLEGERGDVYVQKAPACTIYDLATAISVIANKKLDLQEIGIRHGEKMYEVLLSKEEKMSTKDLGQYFRLPLDNRDLNYDNYFVKGRSDARFMEDYNSDNTQRLNIEDIVKLVKPIIDGGFHD